MKTYHKKRMRKLIAFLRGDLKPKQFKFNRVVSEIEANGHVCGTVCCAMGWTPKVFPRLVGWAEDYLREWRTSQSTGLRMRGEEDVMEYSDVAEIIFGIPSEMAGSLFAPDSQRYVSAKLPNCSDYATPKQVAAMLEKFLALVESGEVQP